MGSPGKIISISVISANRGLIENLTALIREISGNIKIRSYYFESSFLDSAENYLPDLIISDITSETRGWELFRSKVQKSFPDALLIFIIPDGSTILSENMIISGVYDTVRSEHVSDIKPLIIRAIRDVGNLVDLRTLKKEKGLNDRIVDSSRSMISIINRDYTYEKVNATFCNAHNVVVESIVGKTLSEVWGLDTFIKSIKENIDLCFGGNTVRYEANFDTPYFGNRFYEVIFRPIIESDGEISHLLAETFDITNLKLSQKVTTELEEEFKKLETSLPIGFLRCETDGTIMHANRAFLKIIGCEEENMVSGLNIKDFYVEKELFDIHLSQLRSEQIKTFGRVPLYTCTGMEIAARISGFIVTGQDNKSSFIDFAFEDSSRELMLENRLLQAQKLETIGSLAGGIAHDFNNILATILGYSEMMLEEVPVNSTLSEKIVKIITAITRARSLTDQILTFSRHVEQQKIQVNIFEVLMETVGFVESGKPDNIEIIHNLDDPKAMVYADPTQLFRVFLNLMTNGIQAMQEKGGTLTIGLSVVEGTLLRHEISRDIVADEYSLITFEDTGTGMDPSVMQRIFEPYFTTKDAGRGTGLGLSVVHGIVAEIEGEILVKSKKDKGSVFSVYLPVSREIDEGNMKMDEKNLLIITGNPHESRILSLALEKSGHKPRFASDLTGLQNVLSDRNRLPDAIIYMDDSEEVKAEDISFLYSEKRINTPLIIITDTDHYAAKEKLLNSGVARQVLIKPVSLREINNAILMSLT